MRSLKFPLLFIIFCYAAASLGCSGGTGLFSGPMNSGATGSTPEDRRAQDDTSHSSPDIGPQLPINTNENNISGTGGNQTQVAASGGVGISNEGHVTPDDYRMIPTVKSGQGVVTDYTDLSDGQHCFKNNPQTAEIYPGNKPFYQVEIIYSEGGKWEPAKLETYEPNADSGCLMGWCPTNGCGQSQVVLLNPMFDYPVMGNHINKTCLYPMRLTATFETQGKHYRAQREIHCEDLGVTDFPPPIILELQEPSTAPQGVYQDPNAGPDVRLFQ